MHIILDVDRTLIDSICVPNTEHHSLYPKPDHIYHGIFLVYKRPFLREFLVFLFERFESVSIWTNASEDWMYWVVANVLQPLLENEESETLDPAMRSKLNIENAKRRFDAHGFFLEFSQGNSVHKRYTLQHKSEDKTNKSNVSMHYKDLRILFSPQTHKDVESHPSTYSREYVSILRNMMVKNFQMEPFSEKNTLLIDDQANNFEYTPNNGILIPAYHYCMSVCDVFLLELAVYLCDILLSNIPVNEIDHRNWHLRRGNELVLTTCESSNQSKEKKVEKRI